LRELDIEHATAEQTGKRGLRSYLLYLLLCLGVGIALLSLVDAALGRIPWYTPIRAAELTNMRLTRTEVQMREFGYVAVTNAAGLREDEVPPKQPGVYRVVVIGDSYVLGWGVNREDRWTDQLENLLLAAGHRVEIINAGAGGHSPLEYAQRAAFLIPELQPDLVLVSILQGSDIGETADGVPWFFNIAMLINDWKRRHPIPLPEKLNEVTLSISNDGLRQTAQRLYSGMTSEQRQRFEALDEDIKAAFFDGGLQCGMVNGATMWPGHYTQLLVTSNERMQDKRAMLARLLQRIREIAEHYGADMRSIVMPEGALVNREAHREWRRLGFDLPPEVLGSTAPEELIMGASSQASVSCINLAPGFRERIEVPGLYYKLDTHLSPAGNQLVADLMKPVVESFLPKK
jgi:lysophospholipase L1-like esterase